MEIIPAPKSPLPFPRLNSTSSLPAQLREETEQGHGERLELIRGSCFALVWDKDVSF